MQRTLSQLSVFIAEARSAPFYRNLSIYPQASTCDSSRTDLEESTMYTRVSKVPADKVDDGIRDLMVASEEALGGSEWIQVMAQSPDLYKDSARFYYDHIMVEREGLSLRLTELVRHRVAFHNQCFL